MAISRVGPPSTPLVTDQTIQTQAPAVTQAPTTTAPSVPAGATDSVVAGGVPPTGVATPPGALDGVSAEANTSSDGVNKLLEARGGRFCEFLIKEEGMAPADAEALASSVTLASEKECQALKNPDEETVNEVFDKNADAAMDARGVAGTTAVGGAEKTPREQERELVIDLRTAEHQRADLQHALENGPAEIAGDEKQVFGAKQKLLEDQAKLRDAEASKAAPDVVARLRAEVSGDKRALFSARSQLFNDKKTLETCKEDLPDANAAVARAREALEAFVREHGSSTASTNV